MSEMRFCSQLTSVFVVDTPEQNLDNIGSGGNDQIAYRKLCSCTNFADGSWDLSRLPCLSSDLDEVSVLQRGFQRRCKLVEGWMAKPIWKQADPRFVWNKNILDELIEAKAKELICHTYDSLKEVYPASRRGANLDGDVANFIETEQLVGIEGFRSSLLQIRGSILLLWEQIVDLSYKPQLRIITHEKTTFGGIIKDGMSSLSRYFLNNFQDGIRQDAMDLISGRYTVRRDISPSRAEYFSIRGSIPLLWEQIHGDEGQLSTAFSAEMQNLPNVRYVSFDFHHVCGNSNFENLKVLYEQISEQFEKQGYFLVDVKGNILEEQNGIVRSNCIDWLDRTNVTQSYLAQKSLDARLQRTGVLDSSESISMFVEDYQTFRALWVEQGDEISLEYPGTYALKGDLVRYGKQTFGGIIKDGMSALSRYFLNNFRMA
ncbi:hypothetical protein DVH24_036197 [Malus domestica]|uniref:SAC domain-containing protein n=1 Tax=Malus domestica TaxID=3750 RepID=A0A498IEL0_MALDO|nr:hypothetical protein DVH24_036197 [Malus domestica]